MSGAVVHRTLRFGPFELSIGERVLRRDGHVLPLGGRALDMLIYLADRSGEVIVKQELIDRIHQYYEEINADPVVFRWKYKMDEVFIV